MKNGAAVVIGALVMFVSGFFLGYTTAVPDLLRASSLNLDEGEMGVIDNGMVIDLEEAMRSQPDEAVDDDQMGAMEMESLKKMIVPLLTDEEIKRIREEAAKESQMNDKKTEPAPKEASEEESEQNL